MPRSVALRPPSYPNEFNKECIILKEEVAYDKDLKEEKRNLDNSRRKWEKEEKVLKDQMSKGVTPERYKLTRQVDDLERLDLSDTRLKLAQARHDHTIELAANNFFSYFKDIKYDFDDQAITFQQYQQYLKCYQQIINSTNIAYFQLPAEHAIMMAIQKHLSPVKTKQ